MFAEALEAFFTCLDQYSLADLINGKQSSELRRLLSITAMS